MSTSKAMTITELKKALRTLSYDDMEQMICTLYRSSKDAHRYLNARFNGQAFAGELTADFRKELDRHFSSSRILSISAAKKVLDSYCKYAPDAASEMDMLLYFVERCAEYTDVYGDINEPFYNTAIRVFAQFVDRINDEEDDVIFEQLRSRIDAALIRCAGIGWGFSDRMADLHASIVWYDDADD